MKKETHIAVAQNVPIRLQEYGVGIFSMCVTKSALKKALLKKQIFVDGNLAFTSTYIRGGECIEHVLPEKDERPKKTFRQELQVVYEDDYLAVINKPAGVLVSGNGFKTINNALEQNLQPSRQNDAVNPKTVHRLDFPTTGLLLVGKTASSIVALSRLFVEKTIQKKYFAIAIGELPEKGEIKEVVDSKNARSVFLRMAVVSSERFGTLNLVRLEPKTGRRHQLRQHLASLNCPILGDKEYGKEGLILNGKGLYLHAYSLEFDHPITGEILSVSVNPPENFSKIFPKFVF
jgi:23S rRNA pseudouridine1911/1915/1917 synthase